MMTKENLDIVVRNLLEIYPPLMKKINTGDYMKKFNLSPNLNRILFTLKYHEKLSLSQLSNRQFMNRSNCSRAVDNLVEKGYIERKSDPEDKRRTLLVLSQSGKKIVENIRKEIHSEIKTHLAELSEKDINILKNASEKIHKVLSKLNQKLSLFFYK